MRAVGFLASVRERCARTSPAARPGASTRLVLPQAQPPQPQDALQWTGRRSAWGAHSSVQPPMTIVVMVMPALEGAPAACSAAEPLSLQAENCAL